MLVALGFDPVKELLARAPRVFDWPFRDVVGPSGRPAGANLFWRSRTS